MTNNFGKNLKYIREKRGLSQNKLSEQLGVNQTTIARWEDENRIPTIDNAIDVANVLDIPLPELLGTDLRIDNATYLDVVSNTIKIPVLGIIKAGIPIEAQEDILGYVDIPKDWIKGGNEYYGLKINGDSMFPKYKSNDIVIFLKTNDCENGKDCAVMVNGYNATFKKVLKKENGIMLQPYNNEYEPQFFKNEDIEKLPVRIIGVAKEQRTSLD